MSDTSPSGSRWEPTSSTTVVDQPAVPSYDATAPVAPTQTVRDRLRGVPRSAVLAAVAAFLVVATGFGGFALGRASAPDGGAQQTGFTPGDRGGFQGGPAGDDGGPQGTFPGQQDGTAPGGATGSRS